MYTTFIHDDERTYSRPELAALTDSDLALLRETTEVVSDEDVVADYVAAEFVMQANYAGTIDRTPDDGYVSLSDAYAQWEADEQRMNYAVVSDDDAYVTESDTQVWVEGEPMQVVDLESIYRKQDATINRWTDKNGNVRIGSVTIYKLADGTPTAHCVKCNARVTYSGTYDRLSMEEFTYSIEMHGLNHQSKGFWITEEVEDVTLTPEGKREVKKVTRKQFVARSLTTVQPAVRWNIEHYYTAGKVYHREYNPS
jgi:hypothetical protein